MLLYLFFFQNNFCSGEAEKQLDINKNDVRGIVFNSLPRICQDNLNEKVGESEDSNLENSYFVDEWAAVVQHTAGNSFSDLARTILHVDNRIPCMHIHIVCESHARQSFCFAKGQYSAIVLALCCCCVVS